MSHDKIQMRAYRIFKIFIILAQFIFIFENISASEAFKGRDRFHRCVQDTLRRLEHSKKAPRNVPEDVLKKNIKDIKDEYLNLGILYEEHNRHFMKLKDLPPSKRPELFFDTENAVLKHQNDIDFHQNKNQNI